MIILPLLCLSFINSERELNSKIVNPGPRWGHTFIYYPDHDQLLLFGGRRGKDQDYLNDTWIWKEGEWLQIETSGPSSRGFAAVSYHRDRKRIILHGGRGNEGKTLSDLWEWNGVSWIEVESRSPFKADHHEMVYLEKEKMLLAYGGWDGENVLDDTWIRTEKWEKLTTPSPPKRSAFAMIYNKLTEAVWLYGGLWINGQYADIWEWKQGNWKPLCGPYDNSSLDHHSMIYDEKSNTVLGFGGKNYKYNVKNKTFTIEDGRLITISREGPPGRHSFGFTYDSNAEKSYLYGGKEYRDGDQIALADFWEWTGESWAIVR
jgi:hypothetical protein